MCQFVQMDICQWYVRVCLSVWYFSLFDWTYVSDTWKSIYLYNVSVCLRGLTSVICESLSIYSISQFIWVDLYQWYVKVCLSVQCVSLFDWTYVSECYCHEAHPKSVGKWICRQMATKKRKGVKQRRSTWEHYCTEIQQCLKWGGWIKYLYAKKLIVDLIIC